jgi:hypothetical protein
MSRLHRTLLQVLVADLVAGRLPPAAARAAMRDHSLTVERYLSEYAAAQERV